MNSLEGTSERSLSAKYVEVRFPAEAESSQNVEDALWDNCIRNYIKYLRSFAELCRCTAASPRDGSFAPLLGEAHRLRVISEQTLAEMAGVDRSTVSRWLNQKATLRSPLARTAIMEAIAKRVDAEADRLELGMSPKLQRNRNVSLTAADFLERSRPR
jgi:hypothetical protein